MGVKKKAGASCLFPGNAEDSVVFGVKQDCLSHRWKGLRLFKKKNNNKEDRRLKVA